ncbi:MAG: hypothetical protein ACYDAN_01885 [Candidatus Limnocylindrales bacterium]
MNIEDVKHVSPGEAHVTLRLTLAKAQQTVAVVATVYDEPGEDRFPFTRGSKTGWIGVTGVPSVLAAAIAEGLARRERGEYDSITTDNVVQSVVRKPLLKVRNWRIRRAA